MNESMYFLWKITGFSNRHVIVFREGNFQWDPIFSYPGDKGMYFPILIEELNLEPQNPQNHRGNNNLVKLARDLTRPKTPKGSLGEIPLFQGNLGL